MSITWTSVDNVNLTENKIHCGNESSGTPVFVARAKYPLGSAHPSGLYPGMYTNNIGDEEKTGGVAIGVNGAEVQTTNTADFQIATADEDDYKWVPCTGKFKLKHLHGDHPFEAGYKISHGGYGFTVYYIARAKIEDNGKLSYACGKVAVGETAKVPFASKEHSCTTYDVLVHDTDTTA